jgi:hypothetical protein
MYVKEETDADDLVAIHRISIRVYAAVDSRALQNPLWSKH